MKSRIRPRKRLLQKIRSIGQHLRVPLEQGLELRMAPIQNREQNKVVAREVPKGVDQLT